MIPLRVLSRLMPKLMGLYSQLPVEVALRLGWRVLEGGGEEVPEFPKRESNVSETMGLGISMAIRYAKRLIPSLDVVAAKRDLLELLNRVQFMLHPQSVNSGVRKSKTGSKAALAAGVAPSFSGFDWFTATVFILNEGSLDKSLEFLHLFKNFSASCFVWPARGAYYSVLSLREKQSGGDVSVNDLIPLSYSCCSFLVELILEAELPHIFSAFTLSGCTPSQMSTRWLRECFWNVLDFPEIATYLTHTLVLGPDYSIYYCIAVLRHLSRAILLSTRMGELIAFLNDAAQVGEVLKSFRVDTRVVEYMKGLEGRYRGMVFEDMGRVVAGTRV
ncbi:hypothetical protein HDU98_011144 [Podochytrium sp. JEL0797]|nr:hypothetical protein HDU98_011144 [Podochytrium sp. JEL0797]